MDLDNTKVGFEHLDDRELSRAFMMGQLFRSRRLALFGSTLMKAAVRSGLPVKGAIRKTIFRHFLAGESLADARRMASDLRRRGVEAILDYAIETGSTPQAFENAVHQVLECVRAASTPDAEGYVAVKLSAFGRLDDPDPATTPAIAGRLHRILDEADKQRVAVLIDAEQSWIQDRIDLIAEAAMERYNRGRCVAYTTVQLYRRDRMDYLRALIARARGRYVLGVKLVRGAYLEEENRVAAEAGAPSPLWSSKQETDAAYNEGVKLCLAAGDDVRLCIATHNEESCRIAADEIAALQPGVPRVLFAQLLGMADNLTYNLAHAGLPTAKYLPFGPLDEAVPYLVRRMQENSSVFGHAARQRELLGRELKRRRNGAGGG
jgi:proline dehydrogenase